MRGILMAICLLALWAQAQTPAQMLQRARQTLEHDSIEFSKAYYANYQERTGESDAALEMSYGDIAYRDSTYFLAVHWYDQAAQHGLGTAAAKLSQIYQTGLPGIPKDAEIADSYRLQAVELGASVAPKEPSKTVKRTQPASAPQTQPQPQAAPVTPVASAPATQIYDTLQPGQNLAALAKKHYGYSEYWVYIYQHNQSMISDPNRVSAGLRLAIPEIGQYATADSTEENLRIARSLASDILRQ